MTKEKMFENIIRDYLEKKNIYHFKFWGGNLKTPGGFVKTRKGVPDLICCINGIFVGIEVKQANGKISDIQKKNIIKINKSGGCALVCYPKDFRALQLFIEKLSLNNTKCREYLKEYYDLTKNL